MSPAQWQGGHTTRVLRGIMPGFTLKAKGALPRLSLVISCPVALCVLVEMCCFALSDMVATGHMAVECLKLASVTQELDFNWHFFNLSHTWPVACHVDVASLSSLWLVMGSSSPFSQIFCSLKKFSTLSLDCFWLLCLPRSCLSAFPHLDNKH